MNPNLPSSRTLAFTLVELLVVIAIIGILAALLMPVLNKGELRAKQIVCGNSLGQIGLAFHTFSGDHNGKFQTAVSTNDGGSLEYVESGFSAGEIFYTAFRNFQPLSPELVQPQLLICPTDLRVAATNFASLQNENLSYFVGVEGTFDKPSSILAGDRNLATNSYEQPTILGFGPDSDLGWTWELHRFKGNMVFADGHAEQWNDYSLNTGESMSPFDQSFFMPSVVPGAVSVTSGPGAGGPGSPGSSGPPGGTGAPGPSDGGPPNSSPSASGPNAPLSGGGGPASGSPGMTAASGSSQSGQSPAPQNGPWMPNYLSGQQMSKTEAANEAGPTGLLAVAVRPAVQASGSVTDEVVSAHDSDSDSQLATAPFDRHMTAVLQHSLVWLYLLLLLLVLLYLLYRMQKERRKKQAAKRRASQNSFD